MWVSKTCSKTMTELYSDKNISFYGSTGALENTHYTIGNMVIFVNRSIFSICINI